MRSFCPWIPTRLLVLLCIHVNLKCISSFSPTLAINHDVATHVNKIINNPNDRQHKLCMVSGSITNEVPTGKVVVIRHLYRFSPTQMSVENKYAIEERQYFTVGQDRSLEPLGDKSIIFRGNESFDENGGVASVGPALYTLQGLKDGGSVLESCYAMALYSMENPAIVGGKGLEIGSGVGLGGILSSIGAGIATGSREKVTPDGETEAPVPNSLSKIMLTDANETFLKTCISNLVSTSFPASNVELAGLAWDQRVPKKLQNDFDFIIGCDTIDRASVVDPMADIVANCLKSPSSSDGIMSGSLVYIAPQQRENIGDFETKLEWGYGMNMEIGDFALERVDLTPLVIDNVNPNEEYDGYTEFKNIYRRKYSVLSNFDPYKNFQNNIRLQSIASDQSAKDVIHKNESTGENVSATTQSSEKSEVSQSYQQGGTTATTGFGVAESIVQPGNSASLYSSGTSYLDHLGGGLSLGKPAPPTVSLISSGPQSYTDKLNASPPITFTHSQTNFFSGESSARTPSSSSTPSQATPSSTGSSFSGQMSPGTDLGPSVNSSQVSINPDSPKETPKSSPGGMSYLDQFSGGVALGKAAPAIQTSVTGGPRSYTDQLSSDFSEPSSLPQPVSRQVSSDTPEMQTSTSASAWEPANKLSEDELRLLEKSVEASVEKSVEEILKNLGYQ